MTRLPIPALKICDMTELTDCGDLKVVGLLQYLNKGIVTETFKNQDEY